MTSPPEPRDRAVPVVVVALALVGTLIVAWSTSRGPGEEPPGVPVPPLELPGLQGIPLRLADLRGQVVVLDFWATWCVPCRVSMPVVQKVTSELGVTAVAINRDEDELGRPQRVKAFLEELKLDRLRVVLDDGRAARAFRIMDLPTLIVLDREGRMVRLHVGAMSEPELRALLGPVVAG